jgi:hypothetical protein
MRIQLWPFTHLVPKILAGVAKKIKTARFFNHGWNGWGETGLKPRMNTNSHELRQKPFTRNWCSFVLIRGSLLFLAEFLERGFGPQGVPQRIEPKESRRKARWAVKLALKWRL